MLFTLSSSVVKGNKINTTFGWRVVKEVTDEGAIIKEGLIKFGTRISGWKKK